MKLSRRKFLCTPAIAALPAEANQPKVAPYADGNLENGFRTLDGILPLEGEFITVYKLEVGKGLYIGEGQFRSGKFYIPDFKLAGKQFVVEFRPDSWNTGGLSCRVGARVNFDFLAMASEKRIAG